jgi:chromatin structure-remodeling complex subunit RSC9
MSAKDFITNVSTTFPGATAQVLPGNPPKYTIKGVRPRTLPVDAKGRPYIKCLWRIPSSVPVDGVDKMDGLDGPAAGATTDTECGEWRAKAREMWEHIVQAHLNIMKDDSGKYKIDPDVDNERRYECRWGSCRRFSIPAGSAETNPLVVGRHIQTHLPDSNGSAARREKHNASGDTNSPPVSAPKTWLNTQTDERNDAAGLPLASVLVLRNLARQMAKIGGSVEVEEEGGWVRRVFAPVKEQLYYVMALNQSLREYISGLIRAVAAGGG